MPASRVRPVLVAGGRRDPNVAALLEALRHRGTPVAAVLVGEGADPAIDWDLDADRLVVDGAVLDPRAAFVRHDVFEHLEDGRAESGFRAYAWHTALGGWVAAHEGVRAFNRRSAGTLTNKPEVLCLARRAGLAVPATRVTNALGDPSPAGDAAARWRGHVAKPVAGGGYCRRLPELLRDTELRDGVAAAPAIVQPELVPPEVRVFSIAGERFAFRVVSDALDYRAAPGARLEPLASVPDGIAEGLARLMDRMELDFGAADFKTCPDTGNLLFLEMNSGPMFAAFDRVAGGALTRAMAKYLEGC